MPTGAMPVGLDLILYNLRGTMRYERVVNGQQIQYGHLRGKGLRQKCKVPHGPEPLFVMHRAESWTCFMLDI